MGARLLSINVNSGGDPPDPRLTPDERRDPVHEVLKPAHNFLGLRLLSGEHPQILPIVRKLFAALQADDIGAG